MKPILFRTMSICLLVYTSFTATGCLSCDPIRGTYSDETGALALELKSGGNAALTFAGQTAPCTYTTTGRQLTLACKGDAGTTNFTIDKDGRLIPPAGSLFSPLSKKK